ncbi:sialate O-acetylesterase [Chitinophaga sp. MM2321]|uniref:sialate O-acetylesterase n=1 Tax=Chitinophaga sp. MM2321 TaxID=3137178 RepID=UPI0032D5AF3A
MKKIIVVILLAFSTTLYAQDMPVKLPSIISDHAVLQQSGDVKLWGWGPATRKIAVVGSWAPQDTVRTLVTDECTWETSIRTPKAGGPYTIQFINDTSIVTIHDILIGEVWLCGGQSNMALSCNAGILDAGDALQAPRNNEMRFFMPEFVYDVLPRSDCKGKWVVCQPETMAYFSAVGYFFGIALQKQLHAPVGLIGSYMGATRIQPWTPKYVIENDAELSRVSKKIGTAWVPQGVGVLYNGMIHPLAPYTLSGVIWYQGETNACVDQEAKVYGSMLRGMITSWRKAFKKELPFYIVQIAPFDGYPENAAAFLREQQETALVLPNTGMVTIGDLVDSLKDIHPRLKAGVGRRLANLVLKEQYEVAELQPYSPHFAKLEINHQTAVIYTSAIGKLSSHNKEIINFQMAGNDKVFYPAKARIEKNGNISLTSKQVKAPVAVRYCFTNPAMPNVFDTNGLPLMPFRTDKWNH